MAMQSYLSHLECTACHATHEASELHTLCRVCAKVLYARYDLDAVKRGCTNVTLASGSGGMWRWFELMPVRDESNVVTLGEGSTPLLPAEVLQRQSGSQRIWIKEEGLNPTGSFKARGLSAAVSKAKELGVTRVAIPSAGNAGSALAAYGARAGMQTYVFVPDDTPRTIVDEAAAYGAKVVLVDGLINDAVRSSNGTAVAVSDAEILQAMRELASLEGLFAAPEGAATWAGYKTLLARGVLAPEESVVLFNTGAGIKTPDLLSSELPRMRPGDPIPGV